MYAMQDRFHKVIRKAEKQISDKKSAAQTGFEKRKYSTFKGDILEFYQF